MRSIAEVQLRQAWLGTAKVGGRRRCLRLGGGLLPAYNTCQRPRETNIVDVGFYTKETPFEGKGILRTIFEPRSDFRSCCASTAATNEDRCKPSGVHQHRRQRHDQQRAARFDAVRRADSPSRSVSTPPWGKPRGQRTPGRS